MKKHRLRKSLRVNYLKWNSKKSSYKVKLTHQNNKLKVKLCNNSNSKKLNKKIKEYNNHNLIIYLKTYQQRYITKY